MTVARKNQESTMKRHAGGSKAPPKSHRLKKTAIVIMVLALSFIAVGVVIGARYATDLMALPQLAQRRNSEHGGTWVRLSAVSPWFTQALIATEDESFYTNWGVSFEGTLRAIWVDIRSRRFAEGGSTLTQELVRDLLLSPKKTLERKFTGTVLSLYTAMLYSKTQVLTMYVNEVYLGDGAYGINTASERYFGVPASRLTLAEGSLLAGLPQAPSAFNPLIHLPLAKLRQREVLGRMVVTGVISQAQANNAYRQPLPLR